MMGSFTEACRSFDFAESTSPHVLAAFAALQVEGGFDENAPVLPDPVAEAWDAFEPDWRDLAEDEYDPGERDPYEAEPWRHDWASWVKTAMGVQTSPHAYLVWSEMGHWHLDCRFSWKTMPDSVSKALEWLGPFVKTYGDERVLVGYAKHEYAPRPHLFWVTQGRWELEDLNPDDEWSW